MSMAASEIGLYMVNCPLLLGDRLPLLGEIEPRRDGPGGGKSVGKGFVTSREVIGSLFFAGRPGRRGLGCSTSSSSFLSYC